MFFSERLKELRTERNITQKNLASAVLVTERFYQLMERGKSRPGIDTVIALADYFDVSIDYLVGRSDNPGRR